MDASVAAARSGRILAITKYEVVEEIGHGGMATVYRAHDPRLGRDVALKVIHPHLRDSPEVKHRFFVEAQAVAKLRHPNIVEVFDVSSAEEREQYLVVELLRGSTLRKLLKDAGPLPPEVAASLVLDLLGALAHAHGAGVVHRDVKPENVILEHRASANVSANDVSEPTSFGESGSRAMPSPSGANGDRVVVKLTDFGIAKLLDAQGVTSTGQVLGSPAHMAPEQIEGGEVDERADVFGLGVLFYECMVGHLPFEGNNPAQVLRRVLDGIYPSAERERPTIGRAWSRIADRALAQKPDDRYPSASAMRDAVLAELTRLGVTSPRAELESWLDDPAAYIERHKVQTIAALCARATEARRAGESLAAAADYNRALAYAPDDAALLKVVATMHRAEARVRMMKRGARALALAALLSGLAFVVTRFVRSSVAPGLPRVTGPARTEPLPRPGESAGASAPSAPTAERPAPSPPPSSKAPASGGVLPNILTARPTVKEVERKVIIASTRPHFGVLVAVDGSPPREVITPFELAVDGRAHGLRFTCKNELCEPQTRAIDASERDETLTVALAIRAATVVVEGDSTLTYQIDQEPSILIRSGVPARVPMAESRRTVEVLELPSNRTRTVTLAAGQVAHVRFVDPPP